MSNFKVEIQENRKKVWEAFKTDMRGIQPTDNVGCVYIVAVMVSVSPDKSNHPAVLTVDTDFTGGGITTMTTNVDYCVRGAVDHKELVGFLVDELDFESIGCFKFIL